MSRLIINFGKNKSGVDKVFFQSVSATGKAINHRTQEKPVGEMTSLILDDKKLISIPPEIGELSGLNLLSLSNNQLVSLPESIGNLIHLEFLYLSWNKLTSLPESIGNLTRLRRLDLFGNELTSLPESIGNLTHLEILNLSKNELTSLPENIGNLTNLKLLDLTGNKLTSLPESILNIERAIRISLEESVVFHHMMAELKEKLSNWNRRKRFGQFREALSKYHDSPKSPKNTPTKSETVLFNRRFAKEIGRFLGGKSYRKKRLCKSHKRTQRK